MTKHSPIRLAIADDHQAFQQGAETILQLYPDIQLIIKADNGLHLLHLIEHDQPDVVLLDLRMPLMDGFEALAEIKKRYPKIKVIILTMDVDAIMVSAAIKLGANSYLLKSTDPDVIAKTIRECHKHNRFVRPAI